jgi:hypothetical protein
MTVREFAGRLRGLNRKLRVIPGKHGIFGLYLHLPGHPDASPLNGLLHVGGISAPNGFCGVAPRKQYDNEWGVRCRGYLETLRLLVDHKHVKGSDVTRHFDSAWRTA